MPVFNVAPFLQRAAASILTQSFSDLRLLIINDGSTDESADLLAGLRDPRLTVWHQANSGLVHSLNRGLAFAHEQRIPFVARMDGDDVSEPTRLATQIALLQQKPDCVACSCNCLYIDECDQPIGSSTVPLSSPLIAWELRHNLRGMVHGATTFRTAALMQAGGFRPHFIAAEDVDLFLRLSEKYRLVNSPEYLYRIRLRTRSMSVADARRNSLYCLYAIDCFRRRRRGRPEITFPTFEGRMGWMQRFLLRKEELVLSLWRRGLSGRALDVALGGILSPRRLLARTLRRAEAGGWLT